MLGGLLCRKGLAKITFVLMYTSISGTCSAYILLMSIPASVSTVDDRDSARVFIRKP